MSRQENLSNFQFNEVSLGECGKLTLPDIIEEIMRVKDYEHYTSYAPRNSFLLKKGVKTKMPEVLDLKNVIENIISSYEKGVESISSVFDTTPLILNDFQNSVLDTKEERQEINDQLRDILARNENLRKKDFDNMMQSVFKPQDEGEKEVRNLLNSYLHEQKEIAYALRDNFAKVRDALAKGEVERIKELLSMIKELLAKQDKRKEELTSRLKELQKEQQEIVSKVKTLLIKGRELRIKDLKELLRQIRLQRQERIAQKLERREEVRSMLADFKKKRMKVAKKWQAPQETIPQKMVSSPDAVYPVRNIRGAAKDSKISNGVNIDVHKENIEKNNSADIATEKDVLSQKTPACPVR